MAVPVSCIPWHEAGHMARPVCFERTHANALLGNIGGGIVFPDSQQTQDFIDGEQMVAHVRAHVILHHRRHLDRDTAVAFGKGMGYDQKSGENERCKQEFRHGIPLNVIESVAQASRFHTILCSG